MFPAVRSAIGNILSFFIRFRRKEAFFMKNQVSIVKSVKEIKPVKITKQEKPVHSSL